MKSIQKIKLFKDTIKSLHFSKKIYKKIKNYI